MAKPDDTPGVSVDDLRERLPNKPEAPQKAETAEKAQEAVRALNDREDGKEEKDKKTFGRTLDGTGAYTTPIFGGSQILESSSGIADKIVTSKRYIPHRREPAGANPVPN